MRGRLLLVGVAAAAMLLGSGVGQAATCGANSCSHSETTATTIEPILTRSSAAVIRSDQSPAQNKIKNANLTSFSMSASGGVISASATVLGPLVDTIGEVPAVAPYGGQHVLILFQTAEFEDQAEVIGQDALGEDVTWGPNGYNADRFRWFLHWGWTPNKGAVTCGLGIYDPTGALVTNTPTPVGQLFSVLGEEAGETTSGGQINTACSVTPDGKTITWTQPYRYNWETRTLLKRSKQIVNAGQSISNVSAFTWLDHEIGGPEPVGLILGWTWYTDSLPTSAYQVGLIAGDPNPNSLWQPECLTDNELGLGLFGPPGPCTTPNPGGSGFVATGHNMVAG